MKLFFKSENRKLCRHFQVCSVASINTDEVCTLKIRQSLCVIFSSFLSLQCLSSHTCFASRLASFFSRILQTSGINPTGLDSGIIPLSSGFFQYHIRFHQNMTSALWSLTTSAISQVCRTFILFLLINLCNYYGVCVRVHVNMCIPYCGNHIL